MLEDSPRAKAGKPKEDESAMSEQEIDLNLIETFPASDPPSWTLGTDHRDDSPNKKSGDESEAED